MNGAKMKPGSAGGVGETGGRALFIRCHRQRGGADIAGADHAAAKAGKQHSEHERFEVGRQSDNRVADAN